MARPKIIEETPLSIADVKKELAKIKKRDPELNFRMGKTEEYVQMFEVPEKKIEELVKKIEEIGVPRIKKEHIIKLADLLPKTPEEVKVVMSGYPISLSPDHIKKIADVIKETTG